MSDSPAERIGPYRIVRRLGAGGMGEVFLAYDERLDRLVAIKRMRPDALRDPSRRERLRREARAAARLSHPNVVQVYDLEEEDEEGGVAIVLEYVQGRTIAELLRAEEGPLPVAQAVELAAQVAEGLAAAHAAGLIHRDLKAENVVVTEEGRAKILDFGLVKPLDPGADSTLTEHGAMLGTYRAMAPEQAEGAEVDTRADLFSFGVLLYEMLAGRSPFQGATPVATLRNLTGAAPRPLTEVRTDLPGELAGLVHALLEKDPERRPAEAREVVARLRGTAASSIPLSTPHLLSRVEKEETSALSTLRRPRRKIVGAVGALALLAAASVWIVRGPGLGWGEPLRVAVPQPVLTAGAGELGLAASGTLVAALRSLVSLEGVTAIDPAQIGDVRGTAQEVARAVSADEVLTLAIEPSSPGEAFVTLRRIRAEDGGIIFAETLAVPTTRDSALLLAGGIASAVRRAYPHLEVRDGTPELEVEAGDYAEFVEIWQRLQAGRGAWAPEVQRLEAIGARSPRFLEAHLQAATLAVNLFLDSRDPGYLGRARAALGRAQALAPGQSRVLLAESVLAVAEGKLDRAERALAELEKQSPSDIGLRAQRARIAEARGDLEGAVILRRQLVERHPTWRNLLELADLELRSGGVEPARSHLEQAAALVPGNTWPLAKLGELELVYGDLRRAEGIYRQLVKAGPQRSDLTNLGIVQFLLRDYDGAAESYRRALTMDPGHLTVLLNLADAELARGRTAEASALYRRALATLSSRERLSPVERCIRAQCLVRLGEGRQGVEIALEALQEAPRDSEVTYQAAVALALAGEDASALALARKARGLGVQARWLTIPAFERLRADPAFQALLEATEESRRPG